MSEIPTVESGTGVVLGNTVPKNNPISSDGLPLSHHFSMVLEGLKYADQGQVNLLLSKLGATSEDLTRTDIDGIGSDMAYTSVAGEIKDALVTLRQTKELISTFHGYTPMEIVRVTNLMNTALKSIRSLLPELSGAKHAFKLQEALVAYGQTLSKEDRASFMAFLDDALVDKIE